MINIGDVKLQSLTDDHGSGHVLDIFPDSDLLVWETKYSELLHDDNHIQPRFGSTFLYSQGKNILVDTGGGPSSGKLLKNLKNVGIKNNEIDIVVLTHLHPDHVGWNVLDNQPTFQSAKYIVSSTDLKYYTDWSPSFDVDPDLARITRHKILNKLEKQGHIVSAGHFPEPGLGVFKRESKVRYWVSI